MSKGNAYENDMLNLALNNIDAPLIGDSTGLRGSSTAGSLYVSLHTGDVGEGGNQETSESAYTSYARVAVTRAGGAWTVDAGTATNAGVILFPECTGGSSTVSHFAVGTAETGTGKVLYKGELTGPLAVTSGIAPEFKIGQLSLSED
jgi:hypothetical protein